MASFDANQSYHFPFTAPLTGSLSQSHEVVPETTVQLQAAVDAVPSTCKCTFPTIPPEVSATYGALEGTIQKAVEWFWIYVVLYFIHFGL